MSHTPPLVFSWFKACVKELLRPRALTGLGGVPNPDTLLNFSEHWRISLLPWLGYHATDSQGGILEDDVVLLLGVATGAQEIELRRRPIRLTSKAIATRTT